MESIDQLRGLAVLLVLFSHFGVAIDGRFVEFQNQSLNYGTIGVFIFFCVSGYIIPLTLRNPKGGLVTGVDFWIKRIFRLLPLYLIATVFGWFLAGDDVRSKIKTAFAAAPVKYVASVGTMTSHWWDFPTVFSGLEWTLAYEMLFYLVCSLVLLGRKWLLNKTVLVIGVVGLCALTVGPDLLYSGNELQKSAHMYLFFAVGLLVFLHREQLISRPWFSVLNGVVVAALLTRNVLWWKYWGVNYMTFAFPLALFIFYSIIFGRIIVRYSLLAWIGKISYSIYLTHIFVPHHAPLFSSVLLVRVAVWFALAFVAGWILFRSVETPAIQTGRRILKLLDRRAQARKAKKTVVATESA